MAEKKRWETPQILSDLPLRKTDTAYFHFDEFAVTLARLVADPETRTPWHQRGVGGGQDNAASSDRREIERDGEKGKTIVCQRAGSISRL